MKTDDIMYCVDYTVRDESTDFHQEEERRFFMKMFDVLVFLKHIEDNKGKFFNPYVYSCIFRHIDIDVDDKFEKYKESLMDEEVLKKLKRERILNRLTEEEKEILGVE